MTILMGIVVAAALFGCIALAIQLIKARSQQRTHEARAADALVRIERLEREIEPLRRYQFVVDAESLVQEMRANAAAEADHIIEAARNSAQAETERARQEASDIVREARAVSERTTGNAQRYLIQHATVRSRRSET